MARNRSISILTALTLLVGASIILTPTSASACGRQLTKREVFRAMRDGDMANAGAMETLTLRTFHVEVKQDKKTYRIGDIAKFDVTVTRPANEDPLGEGTPMPWSERPYVEAVEGAIVGVGLHIGRVFLPGAALTDADGLAKVRIKIENYAPAGQVVDASIYAWKIVQETQCLTIQENGYKVLPGIAKTTR